MPRHARRFDAATHAQETQLITPLLAAVGRRSRSGCPPNARNLLVVVLSHSLTRGVRDHADRRPAYRPISRHRQHRRFPRLAIFPHRHRTLGTDARHTFCRANVCASVSGASAWARKVFSRCRHPSPLVNGARPFQTEMYSGGIVLTQPGKLSSCWQRERRIASA
jgi:hypothetical protein